MRKLLNRPHAEWIAALVLLGLGAALRFAMLGALPYGLNQDEASAGYEALALLREGIDRCGKRWPVLLVSWGSGQNVLMTYLAMPWVALLGLSELSIRLPNAVFGVLTLPVFWRFARRCGGKGFGLLALGLLAVNPWHIMMSRWALESNLLPFFLMTGIWLTALAREKPAALPGAAAAFGLALYAYGTAFFFLPLFLVGAVIWLRKELRPGWFCASLALFLVLALPIALCQLINVLRLPELRLLGLTLPRLTESRQAATSVFGGGSAAENFRSFLHIIRSGNDGLNYNALPLRQGGIAYFFGLPTAALGAIYSLLQRKRRPEEAPMRLALLCGLVCAALIRGNINRLNFLWLPMVYCSALGLWAVLRRLGRWAALPLAGIVLCAALFLSAYMQTFGGAGAAAYFPGLGEAVAAAQRLDEGTIYITDWVNQPYIFSLFYTEASPTDFADSVEYADAAAAFRRVQRWNGFEFADPERAELLILHRSEAGGREVLAAAGRFVVCRR